LRERKRVGRCQAPLPPADDHTAGGGVPETLQNVRGRVRGSVTGEVQYMIGSWTTGRGIASPLRWTPLDNWSSLRAPGGWARLTAGSGQVSGAVAHVSKRELGTRRRGESRASTGCRVRETRGPPSYTAGRSADIAGSRHTLEFR